MDRGGGRENALDASGSSTHILHTQVTSHTQVDRLPPPAQPKEESGKGPLLLRQLKVGQKNVGRAIGAKVILVRGAGFNNVLLYIDDLLRYAKEKEEMR